MRALSFFSLFALTSLACGGDDTTAAPLLDCADRGEVLVRGSASAATACRGNVGTGALDPVLSKLADDTLLLSPGEGALLYRSRDLGVSWQELDPTGKQADRTGRLHPYLHRDAPSGRIFFNYYNLANGAPGCDDNSGTNVYASDDGGDTWRAHSVGCGSHDWAKIITGAAPTPALQAELLASGFPSLVYLCATGPTLIVGPDHLCYRSSNGGETYVPVTSAADVVDSPQFLHPVAFPQAGVVNAQGAIFKTHASEQGSLVLKLSRDGGATWQKKLVSEAQLVGNYSNFLSSNLAIDSQGALYLVWIDDRDGLPYLSISKDQGDSWSARSKISAGEVVHGAYPNVAVFAPGHIAVAYYGSLQPQTNGDGYTSPDGLDYHAYLSVSKTAPEATPSFVTARINALGEPVVSSWSFSTSEYLGPPVLTSDGTVWATYVNKGSALIGRLATR